MNIVKIKLKDIYCGEIFQEDELSVTTVTDVEVHSFFEKYLTDTTKNYIKEAEELIAKDIAKGATEEILEDLAKKIEEDMFKGGDVYGIKQRR